MLKCGLTLLIRLTKVAANKRKRAKMRNENVMKGGDEFDKTEPQLKFEFKRRLPTSTSTSNRREKNNSLFVIKFIFVLLIHIESGPFRP